MFDNQSRDTMKLISIGTFALLIAGFVFFMILALRTGSLGPVAIVVAALIILVGVVFAMKVINSENATGKAKRTVGMDIYTLIDDLVDDLTPSEARKLKFMIENAYSEDIDASIHELLEERQARADHT